MGYPYGQTHRYCCWEILNKSLRWVVDATYLCIVSWMDSRLSLFAPGLAVWLLKRVQSCRLKNIRTVRSLMELRSVDNVLQNKTWVMGEHDRVQRHIINILNQLFDIGLGIWSVLWFRVPQCFYPLRKGELEGRIDFGMECVAQKRVLHRLSTLRSVNGDISLGDDLFRGNTIALPRSPVPVRCPKLLRCSLPLWIITRVTGYYLEGPLLKDLLHGRFINPTQKEIRRATSPHTSNRQTYGRCQVGNMTVPCVQYPFYWSLADASPPEWFQGTGGRPWMPPIWKKERGSFSSELRSDITAKL